SPPSTGAIPSAPPRRIWTTSAASRPWSSMPTRPPTRAAGSPSRTTREPQAAGAAVRLRLRDLRLSGGAYRRGQATRRRGAYGMDFRPDPHPVRGSVRLQYGGVATDHGRRAGAPALLARLRNHRRRVLAQFRHADGQRRG